MNAVESSQEMQVKRKVRDVRMPMKLVYEVLVKAGRLEGCQRKKKKEKAKKSVSVNTMRILRIILSKNIQTSLS